jgi:hypothetical protein
MISVDKCKDTDRRCQVCLATNNSVLSEMDIAMGVKSVKECYELLIGSGNCHMQIILCKDCLKELNMLSSAILERDKE